MKKIIVFIVMAMCAITTLTFVGVAFYCLWQITIANEIYWYYGGLLCTIAVGFYGYFFRRAYEVWYYDC